MEDIMALGWIAAGVIVLIVLIAIFKSQDFIFVMTLVKKNFFFILFILFVLFVTFSFISVYRNHEINLTSYEGFVDAGKVYFSWFLSLFANLGEITGYALNQDWVLSNSTNSTRS
jgi:hypothetical protein